VTLARCPCGVAFLLDQNPPDYEHGLLETLDYYVEQGAGIDLIVEPLLRLVPGTVRRCLEAPWLLAAEINRVLRPGGVVYPHQAPVTPDGAWGSVNPPTRHLRAGLIHAAPAALASPTPSQRFRGLRFFFRASFRAATISSRSSSAGSKSGAPSRAWSTCSRASSRCPSWKRQRPMLKTVAGFGP
jgi:hypothetical protein